MALAGADVLRLNPEHPKTYVVKSGDTLWDISELFLKSPWKWPRLWQANPQVDNPHLIYPGDRLTLVYVDGEPRLTRKRLVKLSPKVRTQDRVEPIPTIPLSAIRSFLVKDHVVDPDELEGLPYVLGDNNATTRMSSHRPIFARGELKTGQYYGVYRVGTRFVDRESEEVLGQSLTYLGAAQAVSQHESNVVEMTLMQLQQEIKQGDILLPLPEQEYLEAYFVPQSKPIEGGYIMASGTTRSASVVGRYDIVIINKGESEGVEPGYMYSIRRPGKKVIDTPTSKTYEETANTYDTNSDEGEVIVLPDEIVGELMVFKVYDKLSYAIVTRSQDIVSPGYRLGGL
jgi:hypothetical protein